VIIHKQKEIIAFRLFHFVSLLPLLLESYVRAEAGYIRNAI
jgi:hypothetical protein